jgi:ABC-type dipeptide/oligopeptide/nickel transport system permease subunit
VSAAAPDADKRRRGLTAVALSLRRPRLDLSSLLLVLIIALAAPTIVTALGLDAPLLRDPHAVNLFGNPTGPGGRHPLGVDGAGRDVLSRLLYGLRSLLLISLVASALAMLLSGALSALASLDPRLGWLGDRIAAGIGSYPALLLGLALAPSLSGVWRLIVPIALVQLSPMRSARELPARWAQALAGALAIDVGLTFLGVGPGGSTPQLGAMVAQAGVGIVAGVPAWWALLFPGLAVLLVLLVAQSLARGISRDTGASGPGPQPGEVSELSGRRPRSSWAENPLVHQLVGTLAELIIAGALAVAAFRSLGDANPGGSSALAGIGGDLGADGSLLLGALMVWVVAVWLHLRLITCSQFTSIRRQSSHSGSPAASGGPQIASWLVRRLANLPAVLLVAAPAGWLAFLAIDLFSQSVGSVPVLPGAGTYVAVTRDIGAWAQSLIIPWLLLGLLTAAGTVLAVNRRAGAISSSAQQRVARAAGVSEPQLAHQRRRALTTPLLAQFGSALPGFLATALLIEVSNRIPGAGLALREAGEHARPATVSDLTLLTGAVVIVATGGLSTLRTLADPRAAPR